MKTKITAQQARELADKYEKDYIDICKLIELAAKDGKREITIQHIKSYKIRHQLDCDNFDLSCIQDPNNPKKLLTRIWWG